VERAVDRAKFEQMYEATRRSAVKNAKTVCGSRAVAEDAVQEAAIYFLDRLDRYEYITPGLFINIACRRAKNSVDVRPGRGNAVRLHELPTGSSSDLDDFLHGPPTKNY
jgi:DNA-directed RNA polymerase specialized sigma24 family protein